VRLDRAEQVEAGGDVDGADAGVYTSGAPGMSGMCPDAADAESAPRAAVGKAGLAPSEPASFHHLTNPGKASRMKPTNNSSATRPRRKSITGLPKKGSVPRARPTTPPTNPRVKARVMPMHVQLRGGASMVAPAPVAT
jgi:hypothetical protein